MFAFIIVSGFLVGEDDTNDDTIDSMMRCFLRHKSGDSNAHCMECGYVNKACVCKPVSNTSYMFPKDWEDYKATYVEDVGDDGIIDNIDDGVADGLEMDSETNYLNNAMVNRDADIMNNDGLSEWEVTQSEEAEAADERLRNEMKILND